MPGRAADEPDAGYARRILGVITLCTVLATAGRVALPALLPTVIDAFDITPSQAGLSVTAMVGGIALTQFLGGRLADQLTRKTVLVAAAVGFLAGFLVLAASPTYLVLLLGAAVLGVGQGLYLPASFAEITALFTERRGRALGVNAAAFSVGSALGPGLAVAALSVGHWRAAFLPGAVGLAVAIVVLHRWSRDPYRVGTVRLNLRPAIRRLTGSQPIRRSLLAFALVGFVWQGGLNFVPTFLQAERGFGSSAASAAFAAVFVLGAVGNAVAGNLGDRVGYPGVGAGSIVVAVAGLAVLVAVPTTAGAAVGVLLFGVGVSSFWPVMDAFVLGRLPDDNVAGDFGALNTANLLVGSLGPVYVGVVAEHASFATAYAGFFLPLLAAAGVLLLLQRDG